MLFRSKAQEVILAIYLAVEVVDLIPSLNQYLAVEVVDLDLANNEALIFSIKHQ